MSSIEDDDDAPLQLSVDTLGALLEFYREQEEREEMLKSIEDGIIPESFKENWKLSQFWYDEDTTERLAKECLAAVENSGTIACVSCPTLYMALRKMDHNCTLKLFEYDERFSVFKEDFLLYDYKNPVAIPRDMFNNFDLVVADPPYLSAECIDRIVITIKSLSKLEAKLLLCTGASMESFAKGLLDVTNTNLEIKHKNQLNNPFVCLSNYELKS